MTYPKFSDLEVTTMTLVAGLGNKLYKEFIFFLLPITKVVLPEKRRKTKKVKFEYYGKEGSIVSVRYGKWWRGLQKPTQNFKNSISADFQLHKRNMGLKICEENIHISGAKSEEMGLESAQILSDMINGIQETLNKMKENPKLREDSLLWIKENCKGEAIKNNKLIAKNVRLVKPDNLIMEPVLEKIEDLDLREVVELLTRQIWDFGYFSEYWDAVVWASKIEKVTDSFMEVVFLKRAMVNYTYSLGMQIDRITLALNFKSTYSGGFSATYDNSLQSHVAVTLPYQAGDEVIVGAKNKATCHTFMVRKSGVVTHSGPGGVLMEYAHNKFNEFIQSLGDAVRLDPDEGIPFTK